jgi:hypothetical protein
MLALLAELRKRVVTGVVGGSDLVKITEQLSPTGAPSALPLSHCLFYPKQLSHMDPDQSSTISTTRLLKTV